MPIHGGKYSGGEEPVGHLVDTLLNHSHCIGTGTELEVPFSWALLLWSFFRTVLIHPWEGWPVWTLSVPNYNTEQGTVLFHLLRIVLNKYYLTTC